MFRGMQQYRLMPGSRIYTADDGVALTPPITDNMFVWWYASDAVDDGSGYADSIPNSSGAGDSTRDLIAAVAPYAFATLKPIIYTGDSDFGGRTSVGDASPATTGRAFVNSGGGTFDSTLSQPSTWYIVAKLYATSNVKYFRLNRSGSASSNVHALTGDANPNLYVNAGTSWAFATTSGVHIICAVYNGASSAVYFDNPDTAVNTSDAGANSCNQIFSGAFYNDLAAWKWAEHGAYSVAHDATQRTQVFDYLAAKYGL